MSALNHGDAMYMGTLIEKRVLLVLSPFNHASFLSVVTSLFQAFVLPAAEVRLYCGFLCGRGELAGSDWELSLSFVIFIPEADAGLPLLTHSFQYPPKQFIGIRERFGLC
ncbi:hypothetical protein OPV22_023527 [Ensete ventricosum]|uniref:Uncharacterized protein n=1 Tax=Ensete ventricosum TaxID=4639 RepID=A0AAV8QUU5_ENSVE|nr:hypothetical protein OPV22_023527 [Ensete ventricosum]